MKKRYFLLALLCISAVYAETKAFIGIGGGYGIKGGYNVLNVGGTQGYNSKTKESFIATEAIIGAEKRLSENFGFRYYANGGYNFMRNLPKISGAVFTNIGANLDLIFSLPLSEALALRLYSGVNGSIIIPGGDVYEKMKEYYDDMVANKHNYQASYTVLHLSVAANAGMQLLLAKHHAIEVGARIPLKNELTLYSYQSTVIPNSPTEKGTLKLPTNLSAKYVFIF